MTITEYLELYPKEEIVFVEDADNLGIEYKKYPQYEALGVPYVKLSELSEEDAKRVLYHRYNIYRFRVAAIDKIING